MKQHRHTKQRDNPQEKVGGDGEGLSVIRIARAFNWPKLADDDRKV